MAQSRPIIGKVAHFMITLTVLDKHCRHCTLNNNSDHTDPKLANIYHTLARAQFLFKPWRHWPNFGNGERFLTTLSALTQPWPTVVQRWQFMHFFHLTTFAQCCPFIWPNTDIWSFLILYCTHTIFFACPRALPLMRRSSHWCSTWLQIPRVPCKLT